MHFIAVAGCAVDSVGRQEVSLPCSSFRFVADGNFQCRGLWGVYYLHCIELVVRHSISAHVFVSSRCSLNSNSSRRPIHHFESHGRCQAEEDTFVRLWPDPFRWNRDVCHSYADVRLDCANRVLALHFSLFPATACS